MTAWERKQRATELSYAWYGLREKFGVKRHSVRPSAGGEFRLKIFVSTVSLLDRNIDKMDTL